jgi:hypothetical protein
LIAKVKYAKPHPPARQLSPRMGTQGHPKNFRNVLFDSITPDYRKGKRIFAKFLKKRLIHGQRAQPHTRSATKAP